MLLSWGPPSRPPKVLSVVGEIKCARVSVNQKQLFLDLEALSEEQIEVGLQAGVWGDPARPVVERYLDQMKLGRVEAAASEQLAAAREAIKCYEVWAISALIIAGGAMLAAMASAFVAFLALRQDDLLVTLSASGVYVYGHKTRNPHQSLVLSEDTDVRHRTEETLTRSC